MKRLLWATCAVVALAGCSSNQSTSTSSNATSGTTSNSTASGGNASGADANRKVRVAFVTNNASDYWTIARRGVEKADAELPNLEVDFKIPGEGTAAEQTRIVDDLLSTGVDGFAISPVDPANQTEMINKAAAQVLVLTQDSDAPDSNRAAYVGTDNRAAGRQAGEQLKKALPQGGKVMVFVGSSDAQNARDRLEGIKEAIKGSKIEILGVRTDNTDRAKAKSNVADTLVQHPDIAGLVGLWSYNGPSILNAVKDAGKVGKVKIVCFDEEDETLAGVKSGAIFTTVVQQPYEFGYQAIKIMDKVLHGDKSAIPASKQIIVPTKAIDKNNVEGFIKQINQLRGR
jgi:ribose transport system substrate-binding protein